ncbi:MAG: hypothetical protein ABFC78_01040 [Methanoregula sp.]|jgi:hypothetical protein
MNTFPAGNITILPIVIAAVSVGSSGAAMTTYQSAATHPFPVAEGKSSDACKYTGNFRDGMPITFWVAPDVPVPVQYPFHNNYLDG